MPDNSQNPSSQRDNMAKALSLDNFKAFKNPDGLLHRDFSLDFIKFIYNSCDINSDIISR